MISVASLLNADTSEPRNPQLYPRPRPHPHHFPVLPHYETSSSPPSPVKPKMSQDNAVVTRPTTEGEVFFPPFEDGLSDEVLEEMQRYQIKPLGTIRASPQHIPYNSSRKDFFDKTGRNSLEIFQYTFQPDQDSKTYTVMWDYNIGLVRITPFFKCFGYSKTTPAKMLLTNVGLKAITNSITGGALYAQGYWMPYICAKAVCARFCSTIAAALIPIFGPGFPSTCVPRPDLNNVSWRIGQDIIEEATRTAEAFREQYPPGSASSSVSPRQRLENLDLSDRPKRSKRRHSDSDNEVSENSISSLDSQVPSPPTPNAMLYTGNGAQHRGWTPVQTNHRLVGPSRGTSSHPKQCWTDKSQSPPTPARGAATAKSRTSLQGRRKTFSDERAASPYLSALPGLVSINDEGALLAVDTTGPTDFSRNPDNKFRARASTNAQGHALSPIASRGNSGAHSHDIPSPTIGLKPRRNKGYNLGVQPDQNEDYGYDGEVETSPGCDGDESAYSSLKFRVSSSYYGSDDDGQHESPNAAVNLRTHTEDEKIAAFALVRLSLEAFRASNHDTVHSTGSFAGAECRADILDGEVRPNRGGNASLDGRREKQTEEIEMAREKKSGAKRRRIKTM